MFGKNPIRSITNNSAQLAVESIFYTLQGEGPYSGMPALFIRLAGCNLACHFCFVGSTLITMANGSRTRIDKVVGGDRVLSYNEKSGGFEPRRVTRTMQSRPKRLLRLIFSEAKVASNAADKIICTEDHLFLVRGKGWVAAKDLQRSDAVIHFSNAERMRLFNAYRPAEYDHARRQDGTYARIKQNVAEFIHNGDIFDRAEVIEPGSKAWTVLAGSAAGQVTTYNLEVEGLHTYLANSKVAHNCDTQFETMADSPTGVEDVIDWVKACFPPQERKFVVMTGGEPMRQNWSVLAAWLLANGTELIQVETAGTLWQQDLEHMVLRGKIKFVCSPKTPRIHPKIEEWCHDWKYIIRAGEVHEVDGLPNRGTQVGTMDKLQMLYRPNPEWINQTVWLSPCDEHDPVKNKANQDLARDLCLKHGYRLSLQMHKIVGVE